MTDRERMREALERIVELYENGDLDTCLAVYIAREALR